MNKISLNNSFIKKIKKIFFPFYKAKDISNIFDIFEKEEPKNKKIAMFVGGCVRKYLLKEDIDDIDIATILSPEQIKKKFKLTNIKVIETGVDHGSLTLLVNSSKFEVTTLRKDIKTDGRHAEIDFTDDWHEDSKRRDFTINAIYLDRKGNIFDPQSGANDLEKSKVKFIGDPSKRIEEDYLRIIRFIRFSIQYNNTDFDEETLKAIKLNLNGIKNLSKERILNELLKIIKLENFYKILNNDDLKNIFLLIFPEFKFVNRLKKISILKKNKILKLDSSIILASLIIDDKDNYQYFSHKYKVSNELKKNLLFFSEAFKNYKIEKNYFKKDLRKNIYFLGKKFIKKIAIFSFLENINLKESELVNILNKIEKTSFPNFSYNGEYLKKKGIEEGKKIGEALKELEDKWVKSDFSLSDDDANIIIEKVKKNQIY
tara:strand:- start:2429 stop:3718 length:1290 start_codon:yes stop_codon:yes gene_type:complete